MLKTVCISCGLVLVSIVAVGIPAGPLGAEQTTFSVRLAEGQTGCQVSLAPTPTAELLFVDVREPVSLPAEALGCSR